MIGAMNNNISGRSRDLWQVLGIIYKGNKLKIKINYSRKILDGVLFLILFVVEGHKSLYGKETDLEVLKARDDVGANNICISRFKIGVFLFNFMHNGIIQNGAGLVDDIGLELLRSAKDIIFGNIFRKRWNDEERQCIPRSKMETRGTLLETGVWLGCCLAKVESARW